MRKGTRHTRPDGASLAICYNPAGMADNKGSAPGRDRRSTWLWRAAIGALVVGAVVLCLWFGLGQPRFAQHPAPVVISPTGIPSPTVEEPAHPVPTVRPTIQPVASPPTAPGPPLLS